MKILLFIIIAAVNIPVYKKVFNFFFESMEDFNESMRFVFTPDLISLFRREYINDWYGEMKVSFFLLTCVFIVFLQYFILSRIFDAIINVL